MVGGFGLCGTPEKLINALSNKPNIRDLTIVTSNAGMQYNLITFSIIIKELLI